MTVVAATPTVELHTERPRFLAMRLEADLRAAEDEASGGRGS